LGTATRSCSTKRRSMKEIELNRWRQRRQIDDLRLNKLCSIDE
jgi:hypothetical protein